MSQEYEWYLIGVRQMGLEPLDEAAFAARWREFQEHAERLKEAEAGGQIEDLPPAQRTEMQQRVKNDPFVRAVLLGMAAEQGST